jgi:hypothetical protein
MGLTHDREIEQKLHARMMSGDETAPSAVAELYFEAVVRAEFDLLIWPTLIF